MSAASSPETITRPSRDISRNTRSMRSSPPSIVEKKLLSSFSMTCDDARGGLAQLGIGVPHQLDNLGHQLVQERIVNADLMPVEHRPPQQALDDVFFLVRAGVDVFVDRERAGAHVIGNAPQAASGLAGRIVAYAAHLARRFDQRAQDVDVVVGVDALHHGRRALQAHAGIDVLAGQRPQIIGRIADAVELGEDQVPNLDRAGAGVEKDLAARSADAVGPLAGGAGRPEVVVLAEPLDLGGRGA